MTLYLAMEKHVGEEGIRLTETDKEQHNGIQYPPKPSQSLFRQAITDMARQKTTSLKFGIYLVKSEVLASSGYSHIGSATPY